MLRVNNGLKNMEFLAKVLNSLTIGYEFLIDLQITRTDYGLN